MPHENRANEKIRWRDLIQATKVWTTLDIGREERRVGRPPRRHRAWVNRKMPVVLFDHGEGYSRDARDVQDRLPRSGSSALGHT